MEEVGYRASVSKRSFVSMKGIQILLLILLGVLQVTPLLEGKVPSISMTMSQEDLWGVHCLETRPWEKGEAWERVGIVRFDGFGLGKSHTVTCGIRVHGATSRTQSQKHSFRLKFRKRYGPGRLKMAVFRAEGEFDELLLRNPAHDSWTIEQKSWRENARYVNEKWCRETMKQLGHEVPEQRWVRLTLNENFWGIYLLMEMPDEEFAASRFGGKAADYVTVNSGEVKKGDGSAYDHLLALVKSPRLRGAVAMKVLEEKLDVGRFIDYFLVQCYAVNADWPKKNYRVIGRREGAPKFRFMTWDSETAFFEKWENVRNLKGGNALDYDQFEDSEFLGDRRGPGFLFRELIKMPEFRKRFSERARGLLTGDGLLTEKRAAGRYRSLLDEVEPLLGEESERWGHAADPKGEAYGPMTRRWESLTGEGSWLFQDFFPQRSMDLLRDLKRHGFLDGP